MSGSSRGESGVRLREGLETCAVEEDVRAELLECLAEMEVFFFFFFTLVTGPRRSVSLKLSNTRVYEPQIQGGRAGRAP